MNIQDTTHSTPSINITEIDNCECKCNPPAKHGLSNSEPIIPTYYIKYIDSIINDTPTKIPFLNIEYLTIIKDDIKNNRILNKYQINYIKTKLSDEDKNDILELLINCNINLIEIINI